MVAIRPVSLLSAIFVFEWSTMATLNRTNQILEGISRKFYEFTPSESTEQSWILTGRWYIPDCTGAPPDIRVANVGIHPVDVIYIPDYSVNFDEEYVYRLHIRKRWNLGPFSALFVPRSEPVDHLLVTNGNEYSVLMTTDPSIKCHADILLTGLCVDEWACKIHYIEDNEMWYKNKRLEFY